MKTKQATHEVSQTSSHTPTPWMIRPDELQEGSFQIRHETPFYRDNMLVASVIARTVDNIAEEHGGSQEANAAFIVQAVNSHEELLEAMKEFVNAYPGNRVATLGNGQARQSYDRFVKAIAKAEGK